MNSVTFSSVLSKSAAFHPIAVIRPAFVMSKPAPSNDFKGNLGGQDRVQFGCGCGRGGC